MIKVKAIQPFVHGAYNLSPGDEVDMPEAVAAELRAAGLLSPEGKKAAPAPQNKMLEPVANKAEVAPAQEPKPAKTKK